MGRQNIGRALDGCITAAKLRQKLTDYRKCRDAPPAKVLYNGSGFGALECLRRKKAEKDRPPASLLFSEDSITGAETPWLTLLETGAYPDPLHDDLTFMTQPQWESLMS